ncbi:VTT domain-containing protein [Crossiella cryophila]|nr:VTT domain-containing protein [Crossiella cryophila]
MWLALSLGMGIASALIPIIVLEAYVLAVVLAQPQLPWWAMGLVVAVGQVAGKLLYFYAGRGDITLPKFLRRERDPERPKGKWSVRVDRFREVCARRPGWSYSVMLLSATASVPPYAAIAVIAGVARVSLLNFVSACLIGRFARFAALAAAPALVSGWLL